jgi:hypothetical protein
MIVVQNQLSAFATAFTGQSRAFESPLDSVAIGIHSSVSAFSRLIYLLRIGCFLNLLLSYYFDNLHRFQQFPKPQSIPLRRRPTTTPNHRSKRTINQQLQTPATCIKALITATKPSCSRSFEASRHLHLQKPHPRKPKPTNNNNSRPQRRLRTFTNEQHRTNLSATRSPRSVSSRKFLFLFLFISLIRSFQRIYPNSN